MRQGSTTLHIHIQIKHAFPHARTQGIMIAAIPL